MPPKKGKKKSKEELEAEEQLRIELEQEAQRLAEEERRKYAIDTLDTGVEQIITQYCVENVWDHKQPKAYLNLFVIKQLKSMNVISNFELIDLEIITEFNLYNLIFAKDTLGLDNEKSVVLVNLLFQILRNNNQKYQLLNNKLGLQDVDAGEYLLSQFQGENQEFIESNKRLQSREKTLFTDLAYFTQTLKDHCEKNYFTKLQVKQTVDYMKSTYFKHFNLYKYCGEATQKNIKTVENIMIDDPQEMKALTKFEEIIEVKKEEVVTEKEESVVEQSEHEEVVQESEQDEYDKLDPEIRKMIDGKIHETEEIMRREIVERKKYLEEKLEDIVNPKDKKKKKK